MTVMRRVLTFVLIALVAVLVSLGAQSPRPAKPHEPADESARLPNGKSQQDAILKEDHEKNIADAREVVRIATELKDELENGSPHVLSVGAIKKTDEIEKITKRIRGRMRRY